MVPTVALGSVVVVTVNGIPITMVSAFVTEFAVESITVTLKGYVPLVVGVPEMTPLVLSERPGGNGVLPDKLHDSGAIAPEACKVCE